MKTNRRMFLKTSGAAAVTALSQRKPSVSFAAPSADLVVKNGVVIPMRRLNDSAQAMAVRGDRILAVGSNEEIEPYIHSNSQTIDLAGRAVTPGLIDAHSHVIGFGQMQLKYVLLRPPKVHSFDTLNCELAKAAAKKAPGEWIVGRGFNLFDEGRYPRRQDLDKAVPNHPVLIINWSGQFGAANTLALKKANLLNANVKDPYGGKYLRDRRTGIPDGVLLHYPAIYSVYQPTLDDREQFECAVWGMKQFAEQGVTCIHDNFCHPAYARTYVRLERMGRLPCRVRVYPYVKNLEMCQLLVSRIRRYEGRLVRMQGIKLAVDGYALMYKIPAQHQNLAIPMHPQPLFEKIIETIHENEFQADVHAVGDKGVDWTLAAFRKAAGSAAECRRRRHRIEHFPFLKKDTIQEAAELGAPVCLQPNFIEIKADDFQQKLGSENQQLMGSLIPNRTFMKEGVTLAYGADVPAFPSHSPIDSLRPAIDRITSSGRLLDRSEGISLIEALWHHTMGGAYASFDEGELGSLEPGKQADFVIWNQDLSGIKRGTELSSLKPDATYVAGKAVFQA